MYLFTIPSMYGGLQHTAIIRISTIPHLVSALDQVLTWPSVSADGEVGAVGDGGRTGSDAPLLSIMAFSTAMDSTRDTWAASGGAAFGSTIQTIACISLMQARRPRDDLVAAR